VGVVGGGSTGGVRVGEERCDACSKWARVIVVVVGLGRGCLLVCGVWLFMDFVGGGFINIGVVFTPFLCIWTLPRLFVPYLSAESTHILGFETGAADWLPLQQLLASVHPGRPTTFMSSVLRVRGGGEGERRIM